MKIEKIEQKGLYSYTVYLKPNRLERFLGIKPKTKVYSTIFYTKPVQKRNMFRDEYRKEISANHPVSRALCKHSSLSTQ